MLLDTRSQLGGAGGLMMMPGPLAVELAPAEKVHHVGGVTVSWLQQNAHNITTFSPSGTTVTNHSYEESDDLSLKDKKYFEPLGCI